MGGSLSIIERWGSFREGPRDPSPPNRLCLDDDRANLGCPDSADRRYDHQSSAAIVAKQRALLRQLVGERQIDSAQITMRLLTAFGSIGGVLSASSDALANVIDDPDIVQRLVAAKPAVLEGLGERTRRIAFDLHDVTLQQWIVGLFRGYCRERIHVALLDRGKRLIFDKPLNDGELGKVEGSLRQIVRWGVSIDASGVVLMHNHPSGEVKPSATDIEETRRIGYILTNLDMQLEDHLIVAENKIFSMRGAKLL